MLKNKSRFIKKSDFLIIVNNTFHHFNLDYLITLRDSLNILISSKVGTGDNIERVIERSKGVVRI